MNHDPTSIAELLAMATPIKAGAAKQRASRLTAIVQLHHEQPNEQPDSVRVVLQQSVADGEKWCRRFSFNCKEQALAEGCWVEPPGLVLVQHLSGPVVFITGDLCSLTLRNKSFAIFEPTSLDGLVLKTLGLAEKASVRVTVFPREKNGG